MYPQNTANKLERKMGMRSYCIRRLPENVGQMPLEGEFRPETIPAPWNALEETALEDYPWDDTGYRPPCFARVGWNRQGLHVLMYAREAELRTEVHHFGGRVCDDSCMEFFVNCSPDTSPNYLNFEVTNYPAMFLSYGSDRHHRADFTLPPPGVSPQGTEHKGQWWAVSYTVPMELILQLYGRPLEAGRKMRGNFYICGDLTAQPHFGMWQGFDTQLIPQPDFHQPALFGEFVLEE